MLSYFKAFVEAARRPWTPEDDDGSIAITVAENKLCLDLLQARVAQVSNDVPPSVFCYTDMRGLMRFREALAAMLQDTFMKGITVDPAHLTVSAGCGAIIENLFHCLASHGSGVLIPAPYYPAFDNDLQVKAGAVPIPVHLDRAGDLAAQLTAAAKEAEAAGHPVRVLLVTNPNNPLGTIYPEEVQLAMLDWCLDNHVHLVSDEIYGNTVFGEGASFRSLAVLSDERERRSGVLAVQSHRRDEGAATTAGRDAVGGTHGGSGGQASEQDASAAKKRKLDEDTVSPSIAVASVGGGTVDGDVGTADGAIRTASGGGREGGTATGETDALSTRGRAEDYLHVVFGLSKDFGASGLRVGALWSQNEALNTALSNLGYFACASNHILWVLSEVLEDTAWVRTYLRTNRDRMRAAYQGLTAALSEADIPYLEAVGAMFCWVDLRRGLLPAADSWEAEHHLWEALVARGVVVSPGRACHAAEPGFFRLCWSWVDPRALPVAVRRIRQELDLRAAQRTAQAEKVALGDGPGIACVQAHH